ncbi:porin [Bdellovibrio bacteriovorus]|uniref:porin n=1 Tax=Bdellovibrio bacteriovorus TaxID=959 RepID=UPI003AA88EB3
MKKFLIAALATTTMTSAAQAGTLNLDLRADYNSTSYDESALKDFSKFYFKTGRLDYSGKATEDLSFRVRLAFNKSATQLSTDSAQTAVEYAFLTHKMSDMFALSVGRFNTEFGGFEGATSGADLYLTSQFYTHSGPNGALGGENYGTSNLLYMTGVKGTLTFGDQNVYLMATNEKEDEALAGGETFDQNTSMMGIVWRGGWMEKALMTNLSYHTMNGAASGDKHQFMTAGVMWNAKPVMFSLDYLMSEAKLDAGEKDTVTSIVAKFAYTGWEQWTPRLEVQSSEEKLEIGGEATNKFIGYGAVLEYKPYTDTNFRYHLSYNNVKEEPEAGDDITSQEIVLGARLMADFLK